MNNRERLEALRDRLGAAIDECSDTILPQLAPPYLKVIEALEKWPAEIPSGVVEGSVDDFTKRRADRIAAAKAVSAPRGKAVKRGS